MSTSEAWVQATKPRFFVENSPRIVIPAKSRPIDSALLALLAFAWAACLVSGTSGGWALPKALLLSANSLLFGLMSLKLIWCVSGKQVLRVVGQDLEVSVEALGFTRGKLYVGSEIRDLSFTRSNPVAHARAELANPLITAPGYGAIKFRYGPRTVYLAVGLTEADGRYIVNFLKRGLPDSASAQS